MAKNLAMKGDAETRVSADRQEVPVWLMPTEAGEPTSERIIQAISRWAGVLAMATALAAIGYWLLG